MTLFEFPMSYIAIEQTTRLPHPSSKNHLSDYKLSIWIQFLLPHYLIFMKLFDLVHQSINFLIIDFHHHLFLHCLGLSSLSFPYLSIYKRKSLFLTFLLLASGTADTWLYILIKTSWKFHNPKESKLTFWRLRMHYFCIFLINSSRHERISIWGYFDFWRIL